MRIWLKPQLRAWQSRAWVPGAWVVVVVMLVKNKDWFLWGGVGGPSRGVWSSHTLLIGKGGS